MIRLSLYQIIILVSSAWVLVSCSDSSVEILEPFENKMGSTTSYGARIVDVDANGTDFIVLVGLVRPLNATLSFSYEGACGKSSYRDIETVDGIFTLSVPISFVNEVELLVAGPNNDQVSKYLYFKNARKSILKRGDECDYMRVRKYDESHSMAYLEEESCYEIGYEYGSCISRQQLNMPCKGREEVFLPFKCRDLSETKAGIKAGRI